MTCVRDFPGGCHTNLFFVGEDGTEIYGQEAGESFALAQEGVTGVSGVVESVIEVAGNPGDNETDGENVIGGKAEVQEFTFVEESKFTLIDGMEEEGSGSSLPRDFECELCNKKFTKVEILKRHIKTHLKDKVFCHRFYQYMGSLDCFDLSGVQMFLLF